jgi:hypothetical protein
MLVGPSRIEIHEVAVEGAANRQIMLSLRPLRPCARPALLAPLQFLSTFEVDARDGGHGAADPSSLWSFPNRWCPRATHYSG